MTTEHRETIDALDWELKEQLDRRVFAVRVNSTRLRISTGRDYVPDVCVIPRSAVERRLRESPRRLEVYSEPMPLVVELWSPSTGTYDVEEKLREYQWRHDEEIWRIHPYEKTLTAWRLQPDATYTETLYREGTVRPAALPNVAIDLERLFD